MVQDKGYKHTKRLQLGRALELQQNVLSLTSRIGLDVQPPFPMDVLIDLFARMPDNTFVKLGESLERGALVFHSRDKAQPVLILRQNAFYELDTRMRKHSEAIMPQLGANKKLSTAFTQALETFQKKMIGMKLPIIVPSESGAKAIRLLDGSAKGVTVSQMGLRVGPFEDLPAPQQQDMVYCLSAQVLKLA
jgi:hypothetical protein